MHPALLYLAFGATWELCKICFDSIFIDNCGWVVEPEKRASKYFRTFIFVHYISGSVAVLTKNLTTGSGPGCMGFLSSGEKNLCKCHVMIDSRGRLSKEPIESLENRFVFAHVV